MEISFSKGKCLETAHRPNRSAGSHATLATRPRDPRLLPYMPPSPTFSLRARTSPPPSCDWASTNSIAGGQALPRRPPWLPAAMARSIPNLQPSRARIPSPPPPPGQRLGHHKLHRRRPGRSLAAHHNCLPAMPGSTPRIEVLQPSPKKASTAIQKSFNHRHRKLQWHCTTRKSCNRCWILLLPAKLFATSIRQSYDLARTTMIFFAATVAGFCYYRWRFLLHPVDKKASTRQ